MNGQAFVPGVLSVIQEHPAAAKAGNLITNEDWVWSMMEEFFTEFFIDEPDCRVKQAEFLLNVFVVQVNGKLESLKDSLVASAKRI